MKDAHFKAKSTINVGRARLQQDLSVVISRAVVSGPERIRVPFGPVCASSGCHRKASELVRRSRAARLNVLRVRDWCRWLTTPTGPFYTLAASEFRDELQALFGGIGQNYYLRLALARGIKRSQHIQPAFDSGFTGRIGNSEVAIAVAEDAAGDY